MALINPTETEITPSLVFEYPIELELIVTDVAEPSPAENRPQENSNSSFSYGYCTGFRAQEGDVNPLRDPSYWTGSGLLRRAMHHEE
jgi:hypothetical protein